MNGNKRGNILLVAIVMATLMSIMLAMVLRPIRTTSDRMKEQELIYRGNHLAEGIRRFYLKNGRFPFELDELMETEPRLVRNIYPDPMTEDGEWTLVYLMPTDRTAVKGLDVLAQTMIKQALDPDGAPGRSGERNSENSGDGDKDTGWKADSTFGLSRNQITGIRSGSNVEGLTSIDESRIYSDWLFSALPQKKRDKDKLSSLIDKIMREE